MKNSMKIILTLLACLLATTAGYAQRVYEEGGKVIIDASAIPHTKVKKARTTDATLDAPGTNTLENLSSHINNDKVYYKFEVSPDYTSNYKYTWFDALEACANSTKDGGGWRLPTQRELLLIWVLTPELEQFGISPPETSTGQHAVSYMLSATEYSAGTVGIVQNTYRNGVLTMRCLSGNIFSSVGVIRKDNRERYCFFRCIRDLD